MKKRNICFLILTVLWMGLIFWFSSCPAGESEAQTDGFIYTFLGWLPWANSPVFVTAIRKCAHFFLYFVLGAMIFMSLEQRDVSMRYPACCAQSFAMMYSAADEIHQIFVPGRAGRFYDVCLDSAAALCGIAVASVIMKRVYKHLSRKMKHES